MGKSNGKQTVTNKLDPATSAMQGDIYNAARAAADNPASGIDPLTKQAIAQYQGAAGLGQLGTRALGGDAAAFSNFMNPYQQNVIDRITGQFGQLSDMAMNAVDDEATKAHAFGGSRHGVAEGVALRGVAQDQADKIAALQYQGFNDAMSRARAAAGLGLGAAGAMQNLGEYRRQVMDQMDPELRRLAILKSGIAGVPYGQTSVQSGTAGHNGAAGFLGGAATGAEIGSMIPGVGTALGAGIGGLLGMF